VSFLLDTHVFLHVTGQTRIKLPKRMVAVISKNPRIFVSTVSLWEIAIKFRRGKLKLKMPLEDFPDAPGKYSIGLIELSAADAIAEPSPQPDTPDPFDRMLLAQCMERGWKLMTTDSKLVDHPFAWR
jgi:PIN domain nuclease of toxin-antitoxin system